ncbi:MAG: MFS transporter [Bowdeniella nasicola]|nr:MFS transporter [Bowdeniella nasicola]
MSRLRANEAGAPVRAMRVWGAAVLIYVIAVAGRTSFGVAGVAATERFGLGAGELAGFVVVHMAVYALAQIPVGLLLDRIGPRHMLGWGALLLAVGQAALAFAPTFGWALAARVAVGLGDATAFVSVVRLIPAWFAPRRVPLFTQLTSLIGQLGPIVSAVPFLAILLRSGWGAAFVSLAATGVLVSLLGFLAIRDAPAGESPTVKREPVGDILASVVRNPGTWLGFFTHFTLMFSANVFLILWGMPLLTLGQGYSTATAAALISINSLAGIVAGPLIASAIVRHPMQRSSLVLALIAVTAASWLIVLVGGDVRPVWMWAAHVVVLACAGAGSSIGFDIARTSLPAHHFGTASGLVNMGGFISSIVTAQAIGFILDALRPAGDFTASDFRVALAVQIPIALIGVGGILLSRAKARSRLAASGVYPLTTSQVVARVLRVDKRLRARAEAGQTRARKDGDR